MINLLLVLVVIVILSAIVIIGKPIIRELDKDVLRLTIIGILLIILGFIFVHILTIYGLIDKAEQYVSSFESLFGKSTIIGLIGWLGNSYIKGTKQESSKKDKE